MKQRLLQISLILLFSLIIFSCKDNSNNPSSLTKILGIVKDSDLNRIENAKIELLKNQVLIDSTFSNSSGEFSFEIDKQQKHLYVVKVSFDGFQSKTVSVSKFFNDDDEAITQYIILSKLEENDSCCGFLKVIVYENDTDKLISGAEVNIFKSEKKIASLITEKFGYVVKDSICKGQYLIKISAKGYKNADYTVESNGDCDTIYKKVYLSKSNDCCDNIFRIKVKDENGNPLKGVYIKLRVNGVIKYEGTTNDDGKLIIDNICQGQYSVLVKIDGYNIEEFIKEFYCGQDIEKTIILKKKDNDNCCNNTLAIKIKDKAGNSIVGAYVKLRVSGVIKYDTTTNSDGKVIIKNICKGEYSILIKKDGYIAQEFSINFGCEQTIEKTITLLKNEYDCCNNTTKFNIKDKDGKAIKGAKVLLRKNGVTKYEGVADENGFIKITDICKGEYSVLVKKDGYIAQEFAQNFDCEQTVEKTITLQTICCTAWVKIYVYDAETNEPLNGARVYIWKNGSLIKELIVEKFSYVKFTDLCEGSYGFEISYDGYKSIEWNAEVKCNQDNIFEKKLIKK